MIVVPQTPQDIAIVTTYIAGKVKDFDPNVIHSVVCTVKDNEIIGAVAYHSYKNTDVEMVAAGEPGWLNREALKAYFAHPFIALGCNRVTAICHRKNKHARAFVQKVGFKHEGVHRKAMPDGKDAISYGMVREDCKWI